MIRRRMWRWSREGFFLHLAFLIILLGATITFFFGTSETLHLREGETSGTRLPFSLKLVKFRVEHYPGTLLAQDYVSEVLVMDGSKTERAKISMNRILRYSGYRFYQSSYDEDERGTVLTVVHDPVGIAVTYTGYSLLLFSFLWLLLTPRGQYRRLLRRFA